MGFDGDYKPSLLGRTLVVLKYVATIFNSIAITFSFLSGIAFLAVTVLIISSLFRNSEVHLRENIEFNSGDRVDSQYLNYDKEDAELACDIFSGRWVHDEGYPLYWASNCPFVEQDLNCERNGRPDRDYTRWRWQPWGCSLPSFDANNSLWKLQNTRMAFVGDSMGRTQWESLVCMLMEGVADKQSVHSLKETGHVKRIQYLGAYFSNFNLTIEYYRAPFLVQRGTPSRGVSNGIKASLKLDRLVSSKLKWRDAQVLVFNSAHWWTPEKIFGKDCYFEISGNMNPFMNIGDAYNLALETWASWIKKNVNPMQTRVFFRSYEPAHWGNDSSLGSCYLEQQIARNSLQFESYFGRFNTMLKKVVDGMNFSVTVLNITRSSSYRLDAHVANWSTSPSILDCSHWCLPGVPDVWNELLLFSLQLRPH